ncbi:hypothetical protein LSH36_58g22033 [Paralvinella palmiformis]|uniref:SOCS box domain-containing protein n=1 Tax=Paralvinella palmiformis TaxID=53620 RepID=A0AAD9K531_9ANNE|nr:hypothetical protein LSH36_58g22033 [Paralvinella palmiformis]
MKKVPFISDVTGADLNLMDSHDRNPMVIVHSLLALELLRYSKVMGYDPGESNVQGDTTNSTKCHTVQESLFAPMVRLLVMFGARFPASHPEMSFMRCADWMRMMYEEDPELPIASVKNKRAPSKLVNLCRLSIRCHMAKVSRLHCIECLPLPSHLIAYVQIKYM